MQISMKHFMTKIVFNKNPVENTDQNVLEFDYSNYNDYRPTALFVWSIIHCYSR